MKHYAVFINGVRGGTITFNETEYGEELKMKMLGSAGAISIRQINEDDQYYQEMKRQTASAPTPRVATCGSIGGQMVRKMIEEYEGRRR
jgi:hypothetical protein